MALNYYAETIGTFTLAQPKRVFDDEKNEWVNAKDHKGRQVYNTFKIQIRLANVMACFLHIYKEEHPQDPERPWRHDLIAFFLDEAHMKRCMHGMKKHKFETFFDGHLRNIKLNVYHKDMQKLARAMMKDGLSVTTYYKKPKK